jgi:Domain of unknown function (DUF4209)
VAGKAAEAEGKGDDAAKDVFRFLGIITSFMPQYNAKEDVFIPFLVLADGRRTMLPDDLNDSQLELLSQLLPEIADAEMRAFIANLLWYRQKDHRIANVAAAAYFESGKHLLTLEHSPYSAQRLERALRLALRLKNRKLTQEIVTFVETVLASDEACKLMSWSEQMVDLLTEHRRVASENLASLTKRIAECAEEQQRFYDAVHLWEVKAGLDAIAGSADDERVARIQSAEMHVKQADEARSYSHGVAAWHLGNAIRAYRQISGSQQRIDELHRQLLDDQEHGIEEMGQISVEIKLGDFPEQASNAVTGKSIEEAVLVLARLVASPEKTLLHNSVEEAETQTPLSSRLSEEYKGEAGKTVGRSPALASTDENEREQAITSGMYRQIAFHRIFIVLGFIEPARKKILEEHGSDFDLTWLIEGSPFIPHNHAQIYERGLRAGFSGDFLVAAHLLIPQLENSLRYVLGQLGVITSRLDNDLMQPEYQLSRILEQEKLIELFGEDTIFDLRSLLDASDTGGSNIRSFFAHGLLPDKAFTQTHPEIIYVWWITLRLCSLCYLMTQISQESDEQPMPAQGAENEGTPTSDMP